MPPSSPPSLRALRKSLGLSQTQVAHLLGASQSAVSRLESGRRFVNVDLLARMCELYRDRREHALLDQAHDQMAHLHDPMVVRHRGVTGPEVMVTLPTPTPEEYSRRLVAVGELVDEIGRLAAEEGTYIGLTGLPRSSGTGGDRAARS